MSDRSRRWICRLLFALLCVTPTLWVWLRIANRPQSAHWQTLLELQLGFPVEIDSVSTPVPDLTVLQGVRLLHPETGTLAEINRWEISTAQGRSNWRLDVLKTHQAAAIELGHGLHHWIIRHQKHYQLPEISIAQIEVRNDRRGLAEPQSNPNHSSAAAAGPWHAMALRLSQVKIIAPGNVAGNASGESAPSIDRKNWNTGLTISANLQAPNPSLPAVFGSSAVMQVPLSFSIDRIAAADPERPANEPFKTVWLLQSEGTQAVPLDWVKLDGLPPAIRDAGGLSVAGRMYGESSNHQWSIALNHVRCFDFNLSQLNQCLLPGPVLIDGPLTSEIVAATIVKLPGQSPELRDLQMKLEARDVTVQRRGIAAAYRWFAGGSTALPPSHETVLFEQLNLGLILSNDRLQVIPLLDPNGQRLPLLLGQDQQDWLRFASEASVAIHDLADSFAASFPAQLSAKTEAWWGAPWANLLPRHDGLTPLAPHQRSEMVVDESGQIATVAYQAPLESEDLAANADAAVLDFGLAEPLKAQSEVRGRPNSATPMPHPHSQATPESAPESTYVPKQPFRAKPQ